MSFQESTNKIKTHFLEDLKTIRTGRASIDMVNDIFVDAYGSKLPIPQTAGVSISDAKTITIEPWDKSLVQNIEKAVLSSGKNISPSVDGNIIRIKIPELTEETRKTVVKDMGEKLESARVGVRKCREEEKKKIEIDKKQGKISEDQMRTLIKKLDEETKNKISELEEEAKKKEKEIMTI